MNYVLCVNMNVEFFLHFGPGELIRLYNVYPFVYFMAVSDIRKTHKQHHYCDSKENVIKD